MLASCAQLRMSPWTIFFLIVKWPKLSGLQPLGGLSVAGHFRALCNISEAWKMCVASARGKIMWRSSFLLVLWVSWKERNARCFEGVSSSRDSLCNKIKFFVASWVSILPSFHGVPMDFILHKWKEVAFSQCGLLLPLLSFGLLVWAVGFLWLTCSHHSGVVNLPVFVVVLLFNIHLLYCLPLLMIVNTKK